MNITSESDYAIRIIKTLAVEGRRCDAKKISELTGVSLRFSLKILRTLVGEGFLKSFKGAAGGYELVAAPERITILKIIESIEGEIAINRCLANKNFCNRTAKSSGCKMNEVFSKLNKTIRDNLSKITIADII